MGSKEAEGLELRLRRLEDIEAIKTLKAQYCEACDGGWDERSSHNAEKMVALFTEDGVWDGGVYGQRVGRTALLDYYRQTVREAPFGFHLLTNPIIEVRGDRATGRWHLVISITQRDQSAMLIGGVFDDDYARTPEGWRIKRSRFSLALHATHQGSWTPGAPAKLSR